MPEAPDKQNDLQAQAAALVANAPQEIDLDALAAEAVEGLVSEPASSSDPAPPAEPAAQGVDMADLADAVQKLIDSASPPAAPEPPLPSDTKIETLDAHIAELADDMIAGEFADEQNQIKGQVGAPPAPQPVPTPPPEAPSPPPEAGMPKAPEPAAQTPDIPIAPRPAKPSPAPKPPKPVARPAEAAPAKPKRRLGEVLVPTLNRLLAAMSAPIKNSSFQTRQRIGWVALITLFNAFSLWGYLLFFRAPSTSVKAVSHESGSQAADGHGDTHGKDSHAKESKDSHGKASGAKDSHGADSHGTTKTSAKKTSSKKPSPKKSGKKEAAQASHGGGH